MSADENDRRTNPGRSMGRWNSRFAASFLHEPDGSRSLSPGNYEQLSFRGWVLVEIFAGLGNAALAPVVTKSLIDTYLKPLLIGADPWDSEFLWQQMDWRTMAFGRKGVAKASLVFPGTQFAV